MNIYVRILSSIIITGFFLENGIQFQRAPLAWCGLMLLLLLYLFIIWSDENWWTPTSYALSICFAIVLFLVIYVCPGVHAYDSCLLVPLVLLLAKEQREQRRFVAVLALITMAVILLFAASYTLALIWLVITAPLYVNIRAINIYKVANHLSQLHLQELAETHQELKQMHDALQEASIHSIRYAALAERTRLARDLHDGIGHQLTSLIVQLQALEIMLPADPQQAAHIVPAMLEIARKAMAEARQAVKTWHEDESGLGLIALQGLTSQCAAHTSLSIVFQHDENLSDWSLDVSVTLYRVLQEALTNVMRHAEATTITIQVQEQEQQVILTVADNGTYTPNTKLLRGFGIKGIIERSQALGGCCQFSQNQDHGLKLQVFIPLRSSTHDESLLLLTPDNNEATFLDKPLSEQSEHRG